MSRGKEEISVFWGLPWYGVLLTMSYTELSRTQSCTLPSERLWAKDNPSVSALPLGKRRLKMAII